VTRARLTPEQPGEIAPPPVNVRLRFADGMTVPVDCTLAGYDRDDGSWLWVANNPRPTELPERILIDRLPAHTSITVAGGVDGE
jgi:hypothetical protein